MGDDERSGGERLKLAIHIARARAEITSDSALALAANVSYDTLMNWYSGRTTPRPAELRKVAQALDVRLSDLMDVWEGREPVPPSLEEAVRELTAEIRSWRADDRERTRTILRTIGALLPELTPERVTTQYVSDGNGERTANVGRLSPNGEG